MLKDWVEETENVWAGNFTSEMETIEKMQLEMLGPKDDIRNKDIISWAS